MKLITIKQSHYATVLLVLKSKLESEGIKCYLKNELTTQVMNYLATMYVELQVSKEDFEKAQKIKEESI
jgi:hypothetical protein